MHSGPKVSGRSRRVAADQGWSLRGVPLYSVLRLCIVLNIPLYCPPSLAIIAHSSIEYYILLHDWAGNMGKYSVRGWQYWPDRREGQYITRELNISPYCPTQGTAIIYLLYDFERQCHGNRFSFFFKNPLNSKNEVHKM